MEWRNDRPQKLTVRLLDRLNILHSDKDSAVNGFAYLSCSQYIALVPIPVEIAHVANRPRLWDIMCS